MNNITQYSKNEQRIFNSFCDPIVIDNFLSEDEINEIKKLENHEKNSYEKISDGTYFMPIWMSSSKNYDFLDRISERIQQEFDNDSTLFNYYILNFSIQVEIHSDNGYDYKKAYKRSTVIFNKDSDDLSELILFNQRNIGEPSFYMKGGPVNQAQPFDTSTHNVYHKNYEFDNYDYLINYNEQQDFDQEIYENHLSFLNYDNLKGLTIDKIIEQKMGSLIIFDPSQIHCAGNWNNVNNKSQLVFEYDWAENEIF